jgi:HK97 family phage portal protein
MNRLFPVRGFGSRENESNGSNHAANGANGHGSVSKALQIIHTGTQVVPVPFDDPTYREYERAWGGIDGNSMLRSSVIAAPINFLLRTFPEAPPMIQRWKDQQWEEDDHHALEDLLNAPNPFYSGRILWQATVLDFAFGNAYWLKVRNSVGTVVQLWWMPRQTIQAKWPTDGSTFISHYERSVGGRTVPIPVRDIVHFRFGIDPDNPRYGLSQLGALAREVGIDDEAGRFAEAVLGNLGIIGVVISPEAGAGTVSTEALRETKEYVRQQFTGGRRASPLALGAPTKVQLMQYQMQGFDVSPIRDVSEERVCAAIGLPAAVVGFGTGLQQTKVGATMRELRQLAWTGCIIPMQEELSDEINRSLLPEFEATRRFTARMTFDTTKVRALWEDNNEKHTRVREDYKAGVIDLAEARRETGRAVRPEDEGKYYSATSAAPNGAPAAEPTTPPPASDGTDTTEGGD